MFFEAALVSKADLAESSYVDVKMGEFMCTESLVKHGPDVPAGNVQDLLTFHWCFHVSSTTLKMPVDRD